MCLDLVLDASSHSCFRFFGICFCFFAVVVENTVECYIWPHLYPVSFIKFTERCEHATFMSDIKAAVHPA